MQKIHYANTKQKKAVHSSSAYHKIKYKAKMYILEIKRKILWYTENPQTGNTNCKMVHNAQSLKYIKQKQEILR